MAEKKSEKSSKVTTKTATKSTGKKVSKGDSYSCSVCGLAVTVDQACGCVDVCDIVCCGQPMKAK